MDGADQGGVDDEIRAAEARLDRALRTYASTRWVTRGAKLKEALDAIIQARWELAELHRRLEREGAIEGCEPTAEPPILGAGFTRQRTR